MRDVVGKRFPTARGRALSGESLALPDDLAGSAAVLLVAYRRATQTDIDRWTDRLSARLPQLPVYEVPVIPALVWRPLAGWIDSGMRGGVPQAAWSRVVTLYGEGGIVRDFLGDEGGLNAIVVLLDERGVVRWCHRGGYDEKTGGELVALCSSL
jgi:hypothetical protein